MTASDGTYTAGETILINVYFDDVVVASGNPRLQVDIGGTTRYADYDVHGGVVVRFRYVVQAGDLAASGIGLGPSILLNGGTIESTGGTAANLTLNGIPDLSGVIVDAVAPTVASSAVSGSPAPDATTVLFDVTFSEQVNGVDPSDFVLTRTGSATGAVGGIGTADGVTYHVNITGISGIGSLRLDVQANGSIADLAENAMVAAYMSGTPWARGGSTDATLASLVPSAGALDPAFNPATTGYDVTVDNATDSITLTPTAADANATITVAGQTVASGSVSQAIPLAVGASAIPVVVTAEDGTTTQTYTVTVTRAQTAPSVTSVSVPANATYIAGQNLDFTVNFSDNVIVDTTGGTPRIALTIGVTTRYADYIGGSGASALVFRHVVNAGDQDLNGIAITVLDANGATMSSAAGGTPANLTLNNVGSTSSVLVDALAPTVISSVVSGSPAPDATTVLFDVTFSEPASGVISSNFALTRTDTAMGTITSVSTADNVTYSVFVTAISGTGSLRLDVLANGSITDQAGNPMTAPFTAGTPWVRGGSTDATLSDLVPSAGTLDPAFDAATAAYDISVDNATDSITLTPTAADANATITVDGQTVTSGSVSQQIALAVGTTPIPVVVTAEDGATTQTYTVTVTRAASGDAMLSNLVPSAGTLDPAFDPATTGYDVAVDNATDSITLTPTAADANATITVNGQTVASGSASQQIALVVGTTPIPVVVTAEDGATTQTYTVTVTRAASGDAMLASLVPSAGTLDPAFDPATTGYDVAVDNATDSITLTPTAADANATITVNGQTVASGSASQAIALAVGSAAIPVVVTAEDGTTTQAYTVTVTRAASADATLANLVPSAGSLDPAFDPATTGYDVAVDNATDSITLTPTAAGANAIITVAGQAVASGSASQQIALAIGTTAIPVAVTAEDGTTTQTYTVTVTRAASADATLSALTPSAGTLDPAFDPATTGYDVAVDNATDSITLTPTATDANATVTVAGQAVASGSASQAIALAVGTTAIPVVVTAEDTTTTRTYTVTVTRTASTNARLAELMPSAGALDPAFDIDTLDYAVAVANAIDSLTLTPTADDANATITVDGQAVASGSASQAIALAVGSTAIPVVVTAEDGATTRTYTVTVERAQPVPTVVSRAVEINAGETASVDLTEGASGSPFTNAAIVDLSNAEAGTARIERDGQAYRLVFASNSTYTGGADIRFTLSNATGTSAPGTIAFTILGRPDPS